MLTGFLGAQITWLVFPGWQNKATGDFLVISAGSHA
jgi:hypothetical protein